jgi:predicted secreted Zn-dependent protease
MHTGSVLRHEQMHFDLTELAARQLRKRLAGPSDPCRSSVMMGEIDRVIAAQRQSREQEQKLYDRETANGTNENRQRYWDPRTQQRLDESRNRAGDRPSGRPRGVHSAARPRG